MNKAEKEVLFKALECLLRISLEDCIDDEPPAEVKKARIDYVLSTCEMIKEVLQ